MARRETRKQKIERIAVGLAVRDITVELALCSKSISTFNVKIDRRDDNRRIDREINQCGYVRSQFYKEVHKMKTNPDYSNPDIGDDEKPEPDGIESQPEARKLRRRRSS